MESKSIKELLIKMADDHLIMGHRNSEWTGMGPLLEEDIAFSSMAQDKIGQSQALYSLLHQMGEKEPDNLAFTRPASAFHNCQLTELPNGEYDFSLIRHFLFDYAYAIRFEWLSHSSHVQLAELSNKIRGEMKYHTLHARIWITQLGSGTDESIHRLQTSLLKVMPMALGIFEPSPFEENLIQDRVFEGEERLKKAWMERIEEVIHGTKLKLPEWSSITPVYGGRTGNHTSYLQPLLSEMNEVFSIDPTAEW